MTYKERVEKMNLARLETERGSLNSKLTLYLMLNRPVKQVESLERRLQTVLGEIIKKHREKVTGGI